MKKNKDGSTLIVTVIIFMFITTVSLAFLSMVSTNYYGRVGESKRTQNLYGSESGLDTTYNIIAKTITAANVYGNDKVEKLKKAVKDAETEIEIDTETDADKLDKLKDEDQKALYALYRDIDYWKYYQGGEKESQEAIDNKKKSNITQDNEAIYKLTNKVFKNAFKEIINNNLKSSINGLNTNSSDREYIEFIKEENKLKPITQTLNIGNSKVYMGTYSGKNPSDDAKKGIEASVNDMLNPKSPEENPETVSKLLKVENGYDSEGRIQYKNYDLKFDLYNEEDYKITVTSEFKTNSSTENTVKAGENLKVIEAKYSIRVPNYDEVAIKDSIVDVDQKVNQMMPSLAIGGDLDVTGSNELHINGDIFVQGNDFNGVMDINNRTFDKYSGGIKLNNDSTSTIGFNDNVYTRGTFNIKNNVNVSVNGNLYARNIYAGDGNSISDNSQLTVSKETVIDNDLAVKATNTHINLTDFYGINDKEVNEATKVRKSSSIIINDYKTSDTNASNVSISGNAYIMGVAHINTEGGYQTGESVAVKGNYKAYSVPDSSGTETFTYDNPLQVLNGDVSKKASHFYDYWKNNSTIDCGGVYLNPNKTHSIGAIVYNDGDKVRNSNFSNEDEENVIIPKRREYAKNIYTISKNKNYTNEQLYGLYTQMGGDNLETVQGLLTKVTDYNLGKKTNIGQRVAMFCSDDAKDIVIKGEGSTVTYNNDDVVIDASKNKDVDAVIVTKGKVVIDGAVNFRGNIIAGGNLEVLGNSNSTVNISYNEYVTQQIQSNNSKIFSEVFGGDFSEEESGDTTLSIQSNSTSFLKTKLWKIIQ